jgi:hypothetical protein
MQLVTAEYLALSPSHLKRKKDELVSFTATDFVESLDANQG